MSTPHPDAALLAACHHYTGIARRWHALHDAGDAIGTYAAGLAAQAAARPLQAEMDAMRPQVCELRATTPEGIVARLRAFRIDRAGWVDSDLVRGDALLGAVVRDLDALEPAP